MYWVGLLILALVIYAAQSDQPKARRLLRVYVIGLLSIQIGRLIPLGPYDWHLFAAIWAGVAAFAWRHAKTVFDTGFPVLTSFVALCYTYGAFIDVVHKPMDVRIIAAFVFSAASLFAAGGPGLVSTIQQFLSRLYRDRDNGGRDFGVARVVVATQEAQAE